MQLTIREAARMVNLSERALYEAVRKGELPAPEVGGQRRVNRTELLEFVTRRNLRVSADILGVADADEGPLPALSDALEAGGVFHGLPGTDKPAVLRALVDKMPLPPEIEPEFLCNILLAREALGSTALGDGIAIPHVRNPIVLRVARPAITLGFLQTPIEFGALDARPVHALFSLISPTTRIHLHLLARLAYALRDERFKAAVVCQARREEILMAARRIETTAQPPPGP